MGDTIEIPDGYVAYGWHRYTSGSLSAIAHLSVAHLAPAEQGDRPYEAICGRRMMGRTPRHDPPSSVAGDLRRGQRKPCKRCFAKAGAA